MNLYVSGVLVFEDKQKSEISHHNFNHQNLSFIETRLIKTFEERLFSGQNLMRYSFFYPASSCAMFIMTHWRYLWICFFVIYKSSTYFFLYICTSKSWWSPENLTAINLIGTCLYTNYFIFFGTHRDQSETSSEERILSLFFQLAQQKIVPIKSVVKPFRYFLSWKIQPGNMP